MSPKEKILFVALNGHTHTPKVVFSAVITIMKMKIIKIKSFTRVSFVIKHCNQNIDYTIIQNL